VLLALGLWALVAYTDVTGRALAKNILTPVLAAAAGYLLGVVIDDYIASDLAPMVRACVVATATTLQAGFVLVVLDPRAMALLQRARRRLAPPAPDAAPSPPPPTEVTSHEPIG
jgi:hypothetical protein